MNPLSTGALEAIYSMDLRVEEGCSPAVQHVLKFYCFHPDLVSMVVLTVSH